MHLKKSKLVKKVDDFIYKVFINETGNHTIISMNSKNNYYIHTKRSKPVLLKKWNGLKIESVAFNGPIETETNTKPFLIGTDEGVIYETMIEDSREKYLKMVYNINESMDQKLNPISGIHIELMPLLDINEANKWFVIVVTPTRFYQILGGPTFEEMFKDYANDPKYQSFVELPTDLNYSSLEKYAEYQNTNKHPQANAMAWLTGAGIYHGNLDFENQLKTGDQVISNGSILFYPKLHKVNNTNFADITKKKSITPISLVRTNFHFLLLTKNRLIAINRLSEEIVFNKILDKKFGDMKGLSYDYREEAVFMYSDHYVFEIEIDHEDKNVWKLFLDRKKYDKALQYCENIEQKDEVLNAQAEHNFDKGLYEIAASIYAKTNRSFEEITLKFVEKPNAKIALKAYLLTKLNQLKPEEATQLAMVCTWLTEIFLDNLNAIENKLYDSKEADDEDEYKLIKNELDEELEIFKDFLETYEDVLRDLRSTVFDLISSYGRTNEMLFYAKLIDDMEWVLDHYITYEKYTECVQTLANQDPVKYEDLYYKFAPVLLQNIPEETVNMLINARKLQPSRFLPALMRYDTARKAKLITDHNNNDSNQAIRYLEYCIFRLRNTDQAMHNFLVSLYAEQESEVALLTFIKRFKERPIYDYKYALRLCYKNNRKLSCVAIYTSIGRYEEAVKLALEVDVDEAKSIAEECPKRYQKPLWLHIAKYVIVEKEDVQAAIDIVRESKFLTLEDILPYFPDFVHISDFKNEICNSLESYNSDITKLKQTMYSYTNSAKNIRQEINDLKKMSTYIRYNQKCDISGKLLISKKFLVFPCTHAFHLESQMQVCQEYLDRNPDKAKLIFNGETDASKRQYILKNYASSECSLCGEIMIESVQLPFLSPEMEGSEIKSWEI